MAPSTPARRAYLSCHALVFCCVRAADDASCRARGRILSCRRPLLAVVHCGRTGQGPQTVVEKLTTIHSRSPRELGFQVALCCPCGQTARCRSKSTVKEPVSNPLLALACGDRSATRGVTKVIPKASFEVTISSAEG